MKVLVITKRFEKRYAESLHLGFIREFGNLCKRLKIVQNFDVPLQLHYRRHKPDVILCYSSHHIPNKYFRDVKCPKVMIEIDFHHKLRDNNLRWYKRNGFDLIIQRGAFKEKIFNIPTVWLPFSVDHTIFRPPKDPNLKRKNVIGFMGSETAFYKQRKKALKLLENAGILERRKSFGGRKDLYSSNNNVYPNFLRTIKSGVTSTEIKSPHGKTFEIMASGTVLLTPSFHGSESLFESECYVEYKDDCSDVVEKAKKILHNNEFANRISSNALKEIRSKHTHKHRAKELYRYINKLLNKKPIKEIWKLQGD
jgi:hypothetical protein